MTKPDDIPQDVWEAANMVSAVWKMPGSDNHLALTVEIGLAIMAEREACAASVTAFSPEIHFADIMSHGIYPAQSDINEAIAAAIRNRGAA